MYYFKKNQYDIIFLIRKENKKDQVLAALSLDTI